MRQHDRQRGRLGARLSSLALLPLLLGGRAQEARAGAAAWAGAERLRVTDEAALLVWEADTQTEHLVHSATFEGAPSRFAFLVPVPGVPVIAEADESVFEQLERFWQARRPSELSYSFGGLGSALLSPTPAPVGVEAPVQVLATTRVAGLDAAVLDGRSSAAIGDWLRENGYDHREPLGSWLEPYVSAGYKIVAFKYAKRVGAARVGSRAVRLSFKTSRPFFPYREPSDEKGSPPRTFRLYALGATSLEAKLGQGPWGGVVRYSGPLRDVRLPFSRLASPWGTFFEETAGARSQVGELFLTATATPQLVRATPRVVDEAVVIPVELVGVALVGGVWFALKRRRRRSDEEELAKPE